MDFKIDENLPIEAADVLRAAGLGAETIADEGMVGSPDPDIAKVCQDENRVLLTLDLDFADIRAYPPGDYHGLVVFRPKSQAKPHVLNLLQSIIETLGSEPVDGRLWIVDENGIRIRESNSS